MQDALNRRAFLTLGLGLAALPLMPRTAFSAAFNDLDINRLQLASVHAVITDMTTGATLFSKNADYVVPIASITKLMTAMVVMDSGQSMDEWVTILERDRPTPVNAYTRLRVGSQAQRRDLMRMTLTASENLAAHVLARHYPGGFDAFIAAMNKKAAALGMANTTFVDASGLSFENQSSANDLTLLVAAAHNYPEICQLSVGGNYHVNFRQPRYSLGYGNTNVLVHRGAWDISLSKTGYLSAAGRCLVMVSRIEGRPVSIVLLNAFGRRTPIGDAGRVRRWMETGYGGQVAGAALDYERRMTAALEAKYHGGTTADAGSAR